MKDRHLHFMKEVSTVVDGPPIKRNRPWHGLPELSQPISMRPVPRPQDDFRQGFGASPGRPEVSALSDATRIPGGTRPSTAMLPSRYPVPLPPGYDGSPSRAYAAHGLHGSQYARDYVPASVPSRSPRHHGYKDGRPSNRSEAAILAWNLSQQLDAGLTFRQELDLHNTTFREVTRQVAVHCNERGELLRRLQGFYTRSTDATAKLAERSVRRAYEEQIASLQAQLSEKKEQLKEAKAQSGQGGADREQMTYNFRKMSTVEQKEVLTGLMVLYNFRKMSTAEQKEVLTGLT